MLEVRSISSHDLGPQLHLNHVEPSRMGFQAAFNREYRFNNKPAGGIWTSTLDEATGISDWIRWCRSESYGDVDNKYWWILTPQPGLTLVEIDSYRDLQDLIAVAAAEYDDAIRHGGAQIDFEKLRDEGYAGIHLTENGNYECHTPTWNGQPHLNSWDVESTLWFDWSFTDVSLYQTLPQRTAAQVTDAIATTVSRIWNMEAR